MQLPDLRAFEIAATVIETRSMSAAAERLRITQSAVSQAMKRAESILAVNLVHRDKRPLVPTEAGRILVDHFHDLAARAERAIEEVRATARLPERQDLRLGMVDSFASAVGPVLIRHLMEGAIALRLTALSGLAGAHGDALVRRDIDAAITSDGMEDLGNLVRYPLFREPFLMVAPVAWAEELENLSLKDIVARKRLIRYSARSHMGSQVERHLRRLRIEHPHELSFDTADSLLGMVAGGVGVTITTPLCLLQGAIHLPKLAVWPLPSPGFSREIGLVIRRGELDVLGLRIAEAARHMLRRYTLPQIIENIPLLRDRAESMVLSPSADADVPAGNAGDPHNAE